MLAVIAVGFAFLHVVHLGSAGRHQLVHIVHIRKVTALYEFWKDSTAHHKNIRQTAGLGSSHNFFVGLRRNTRHGTHLQIHIQFSADYVKNFPISRRFPSFAKSSPVPQFNRNYILPLRTTGNKKHPGTKRCKNGKNPAFHIDYSSSKNAFRFHTIIKKI